MRDDLAVGRARLPHRGSGGIMESPMTTGTQADIALVREAAQQLLARLESVERFVGADGISPNSYPQVAAAIDDCLAQVVELRLWGPDNRLPSSELWNVAGHLLAR